MEEILRDGLPPKDGDPRIGDIAWTTERIICDKVRSAFACITLRQDNVQFNGGKKAKHTSMRMHAESLGMTDHHKHRDDVLQGNKICFAARAYAKDIHIDASADSE